MPDHHTEGNTTPKNGHAVPAAVHQLDEEKNRSFSRDIEPQPIGETERTKTSFFGRARRQVVAGGKIPEAELAEAEIRPIPRHYVLNRPRALQWTYKGERIAYGDDAAPITHQSSHNSVDVKYTAEGVAKARERLDLFIDLVWVGIISNLSEVFSVGYFEQGKPAGQAFLQFLIVFLPAWRIWNFFREFLNSFYMDDAIQRVFTFWVLVLSVFFGNNIAYFPAAYAGEKTILVSLYLFIRASFLVATLVYSVWIPWMRKIIILNVVVSLPSVALWVAVIYVDGSKAVAPAFVAVVWDYAVPIVLDTGLADKLTPGHYQREIDARHLRTRMGNFLIITIGEGVLTLVRGGPLGIGITAVASLAVWSLLIYFSLAYIYFNRDNSVRYVPAVRHRGWRLILWVMCHVPVFSAFIALSSGILYFINENANNPLDQQTSAAAAAAAESGSGAESSELTSEQELDLVYRALWVIATSLSVIVLSFFGMALLDKPLDPPGTLLVNNRVLRLAARPAYVLIICLVLLADSMSIYLYLGICGLGISLVLLYEVLAALETPARFFEPKGLTTLMKKEFRAHAPADETTAAKIII